MGAPWLPASLAWTRACRIVARVITHECEVCWLPVFSSRCSHVCVEAGIGPPPAHCRSEKNAAMAGTVLRQVLGHGEVRVDAE